MPHHNSPMRVHRNGTRTKNETGITWRLTASFFKYFVSQLSFLMFSIQDVGTGTGEQNDTTRTKEQGRNKVADEASFRCSLPFWVRFSSCVVGFPILEDNLYGAIHLDAICLLNPNDKTRRLLCTRERISRIRRNGQRRSK